MKLDLDTLDEELRAAVLDIAAIARKAGGRALMVGGAVRDLSIGAKSVKDVDLEVFGVQPEDLQKAIGAKVSESLRFARPSASDWIISVVAPSAP